MPSVSNDLLTEFCLTLLFLASFFVQQVSLMTPRQVSEPDTHKRGVVQVLSGAFRFCFDVGRPVGPSELYDAETLRSVPE